MNVMAGFVWESLWKDSVVIVIAWFAQLLTEYDVLSGKSLRLTGDSRVAPRTETTRASGWLDRSWEGCAALLRSGRRF
jgi:hypothetical protein